MSSPYPNGQQQGGYAPVPGAYPPSGQPGFNTSFGQGGDQPGYAPPGQPGYGPPGHPGYAPPGQPGYAPPGQPGYGPPGFPPQQVSIYD